MIYKQENGSYYCKFQVSGVQKHLKCKGAKSKRDAERIERQLRKQTQETIDLAKENSKRYLISALFTLHIKDALAKGARDIKHIKTHHKYFKKYFEENNIKYADEIQKSTIKNIMVELLEDDNKPPTVNRYFSTISRMLTVAVEDNIIEKNPCSGIHKLPEDNIQIKFWSDEEAHKVIEASNEILQDMIKTALYIGIRKSNIRLMEKAWVNLTNKTITIPAYANKSKKNLEIPLKEQLYEILKKRILDTNNKSLYVFINTQKQSPIADDTMRKWLSKACEQANVKYIGWHGLRHTFATNAIRAGMDIIELKEVLGHSTLTMVLRYAHANDTSKREVLNKMPNF